MVRKGKNRFWYFNIVLALSLVALSARELAFAINPDELQIPVVRVRRGDFIQRVRVRGEIKSERSVIISAPQVPDLVIVRLVESGTHVKRGDVVVEFDRAALEQSLLEAQTALRQVESQIVQTKAQHRIINEADQMALMQAQYNLERAKLEASKAEILSEIEGAKARIDVQIAQRELEKVQATIKAHQEQQKADLDRLEDQRQKAIRDLERIKRYLSQTVLRAPIDGIVNILPNFRAGGSWGRMPPPFKEGDAVWTGAAIAEIPDLSEMRVDLELKEADRGPLKLGQEVLVRVDAIPDRSFRAELSWISPVAELVYRGFRMAEKVFPAHAKLVELDDRLRPGMSCTADVIIQKLENVLLIPVQASFLHEGQPAVYVFDGERFTLRPIKVGERNNQDVVVVEGLQEGELVSLVGPDELKRRNLIKE